jgi:hypothetical protein
LNYDRLLTALHRLRFNLLLCAGLQLASALSLGPHALDCRHHISLLRQESVSEIRRPLNVFCQLFHDIRERSQSLNARIPRLLRYGISERLVFKARIFFHPLLELDDFDRVCGSSQRLRQKRVRIKSDRRDKRIQLIVRNLRCGFLRCCIRSNLSGFGGWGSLGQRFS